MVPDLVQNRALFDKFNRIRFSSVHHVFPDNYYLIFKIVPLLLHTNFRGFPGFVDHPETPHGIKFYTPDEETLVYVHKYFSSKIKFSQKSEGRDEGFIEFLSVMGSVGSVAQTKRSDFDMWVGINRSEVDDDAFKRFVQKLRDIEQWLANLRIEVHFFPTDIQSVSKNVFGAVDDESCGSAQALMLKDEYYRTAILITGKIAYWWVVDPGVSEQDYTSLYGHFLKTEESFSRDYIDIGNVQHIDKSEFFGAALWQLIKSLHYPFKSFIKMCLIEKYLYADSADHVTLLSTTLKENVLRNQNLEVDAIDSYLLMYNSIESFFLSRNRTQEVDLLRSCFYMKVQPNLSSLNKYAHADIQKRNCLARYVKNWQWDSERVKRLDTFYLWSLDDLMKFDQTLRVYMIQTFSQLTKSRDLVGNNSLISENDLKVISRKLLSYYLAKPKKVKNFCFSFDDNVFESELNLVKDESWRLYRGEAKRESRGMTFSSPLYSSPHLSDICLWIAYSKIFSPFQTKLSVYSGEANLSYGEISKLIGAMGEHLFTHGPSKSADFLIDPYVRRVFLTAHLDPGDEQDRFSVFYLNSWGELFAEHFSNEFELEPLICEMISGYLRLGRPNPVQFIAFQSIAGGMKELLTLKGHLTDVLSAFRATRPDRQTAICLARWGDGLVAYVADKFQVRSIRRPDLSSLIDAVLTHPTSDAPRHYQFDSILAQDNRIGQIVPLLKPGEWDVFILTNDDLSVTVCFADDLNRLSAAPAPANALSALLSGFQAALSAADPAKKINFHRQVDSRGKKEFLPVTPSQAAGLLKAPTGGFRLKAIQRAALAGPLAISPAQFAYEDDSGVVYDLSDASQAQQFAVNWKRSGALPVADIHQVILDKSTVVTPGVRILMKLELQKKLREVFFPGSNGRNSF